MRHRFLSRVLRIVAFVLIATMLAACGQPEAKPPAKPETKPAAPKPVVLGMPSDPSTLDPHMTGANVDWNICFHIFDSFVGRDKDGKTVPALAEKWEMLDAKTNTYRFYLRKNVKFHNGEPWNTEVAVWNFERAKKEPLSKQKRYAEEALEIKVIDEYTMDIKLMSPLNVAMGNLVQFIMVPKKYLQEVGNQTFGIKPVGTGPYKFVQWVKDDHITLVANEQYWGGAPEIKNAIIKPVPEPATRVAGLISGDLDIIRGVSVFDTEKIKSSGVANVVSLPGPREWHINLDTFRSVGGPKGSPGLPEGKNPFQDVRVRRAMYYAINADELIAKAMKGYATAASQLVAPTVWGYNPEVKRLPFDPEKAKALLKEAGYPNGFKVRFDVGTGWELVAEAIANYLGNVGIKVDLNVLTSAVKTQKQEAYETSMSWNGWGATFINTACEGVVHTVNADKGFGRANYGRYSNKALDALIEKAASIMDPNEQLKVYQQCEKALMDDVGIIPVFHEGIIAAARKGFTVTPTSFEHVYLHYAKIVK